MADFDFQCPHCKKACTLSLRVAGYSKPDEHQTYLPAGDIEEALREYAEKLDVTDAEGKLIFQSKGWLDKDTWNAINKIIKAHGGKWISGGKESHWEVPQ